MASNPWEVSEAEYQKNVQLFNQLTAGNPYMDANTAKNALMRSNLPPQILGQIWALSDLDKDGRLDIREYSIAMRLAFNCLAGCPLPPQLPPSLLVVPSRSTPIHQGFPPMSASLPPMAPMVPQAAHSVVGGGVGGNWTGSRQSSIDHQTPERRMSQQQFGAYPTAPASINQSRHNSISGSPSTNDRSVFEGRQLDNWAIPHHNKLKYSQLFNALDKERLGFLSTQIGRSALGLSGLSTSVLAHIWFLSDVNRDGKLSVDEYCISQYMIEMFKAGYALPQTSPPELVRMCGISRSANNTPELEPGAEPPQKSPAPKTFEDKRQDNLAKGQAELERRRQILMEEENRRRAEIEKKEREEEARRDRERQEKERQMELERQAEMERQRILEQQREEEERKRRAEFEKKKEEEEKLKKIALEKAKVKQMQSQKQQESERLAQRQQREKTLAFQLQALDEKAIDIEMDIGKAKEGVADVTGFIEGMRGTRDEKVGKIQQLQKENQQLAIESQEMGHQLLQMQSAHKETTNRKNDLENLRRKRDALRKAIEDVAVELVTEKEKTGKQKELLEEKEVRYKDEVNSKLLARREEYRKVFELLVHAQKQARSKLTEYETKKRASIPAPVQTVSAQVSNVPNGVNSFSQSDAFADFDSQSSQFDSAFGVSAPIDPFASSTNFGTSAAPPARPAIPSQENRNSVVGNASHIDVSTNGTSKCRALFAFEARSEDELSFEPGDVIIVFQSHAAEPGWRAGQLRDKVGWFPEAFVESIANVPQHGSDPPIQNMPPNVTPSCSLDKIPEEEALRKAEIAKVLAGGGGSTETVSQPVICQCVAQFQWRARNEDDLSFSKGDVIDVVEKQEMKWRGRKANGENGWFPKSYVKIVGSGEATPVAGTPTKPVLSPTAAQYDVVPGAEGGFGQVSSDDWYVATFDFDAVESTDLTLRVGDRILVLEKNDEWWKGRCNGRDGIFPANYVEKATSTPNQSQVKNSTSVASLPAGTVPQPVVICQAKATVDFVASAPNQIGIKVGEIIKVREKSATGWWEGEIVRNGVPMAGWFPGEYVNVVEGSAKSSISNETAFPTAITMFDYDASQDDELTIKVGDIIVVTDQTDAEWWKGHRVAEPTKTGLFPANYVQVK